jgi:monoamine oxidase
LFSAVRRALHEAGAGRGPRALSRRHFLASAASAAALAACRSAGASVRHIGVVGGGAAGLTAAYRLTHAGRRVTLYEASARWGGRMLTRANFNEDGQFCELGGEFVDTRHAALRALADELGVGIERLAPEDDPGEDIYHFGGRLYAQHDMVDANGGGAFVEAATRIAADQAALLDAEQKWTVRARELDALSLKAYLGTLADVAPAWALALLDVAYLVEFGIATDQQSALNLIDMVGVDTKNGFQIFGESDEAYRIRGGSSALIAALQARLGANVTQRLRWSLTRIARADSHVALAFDTSKGGVEARHDAVVLALPFTRLRTVGGLDGLGLEPGQLRAIREMAYGDHGKLMVSTTSRPWRQAPGFPAPSSGAFYADTGMQTVWETSRAQPGARGVLTNLLANRQEADALEVLTTGLRALSPAIADSLDGKRAAMFWARHPFTLGSYAGARVGQYTTIFENAATPALGGRIQFAGEHTSVDFLGYMNGAVETGERAAKALLDI